jgi:hypothetical protein
MNTKALNNIIYEEILHKYRVTFTSYSAKVEVIINDYSTDLAYICNLAVKLAFGENLTECAKTNYSNVFMFFPSIDETFIEMV